MNAEARCHEIPGCPGIFFDAFRGRYLRLAQNPDNAFILSHYHGDHYGSLPRDYKYQGPCQIHCTPVTAALLRNVHLVASKFVVEHQYGETFSLQLRGREDAVQITLLDANHCPGAAIVLIELSDGTVHLHTGDMRYHEKMKDYPLLRAAALQRKLDTVLLDTTYGHPKNDFPPQEEAIESIAAQVYELLGSKRSDMCETLVLLSCYSIGKEKCLWEASTRCNRQVYVSERKMEMLKCASGHQDHISSQVVHRCTLDPKESDLHVIRMGMAGQMHPFFQPDYWACARYAEEQPNEAGAYSKVVAFIPTGWADSSNWNRKHAITRCQCNNIQVEIRLISYSEHSTYSELQTFINFLNPRKVVATVFKDEKDRRKIEGRFKIDNTRAKKNLIESMFGTGGRETFRPDSIESIPVSSSPGCSGSGAVDFLQQTLSNSRKSVAVAGKVVVDLLSSSDDDEDRDETLISNSVSVTGNIQTLLDMGFDREKCILALTACNGDVQAAVARLLSSGVREHKTSKIKLSPATTPSPRKKQAKTMKSQQITSFFSRNSAR